MFSLDLVDQTYALTAVKIELFEFHIGTKYNVEVEAVPTTVVAIPIVISVGQLSVAEESLGIGVASECQSYHGTNKWRNLEIAVDGDAIIEQKGNVNQGLCFFNLYGVQL